MAGLKHVVSPNNVVCCDSVINYEARLSGGRLQKGDTVMTGRGAAAPHCGVCTSHPTPELHRCPLHGTHLTAGVTHRVAGSESPLRYLITLCVAPEPIKSCLGTVFSKVPFQVLAWLDFIESKCTQIMQHKEVFQDRTLGDPS